MPVEVRLLRPCERLALLHDGTEARPKLSDTTGAEGKKDKEGSRGVTKVCQDWPWMLRRLTGEA